MTRMQVSAPSRQYIQPTRRHTPANFYVGDLVLCQYDAYPVWPAVICKADDGSLTGKFRAVVPTSDGGTTTAYHCFFFDDDSSAWIRDDLIVKFHPSLVALVQVAPSEAAYYTAQMRALNQAQNRFSNSNTTEGRSAQSDPLSASNDQDRLALALMLGQWFLHGNSMPSKPRLQIAEFCYDAAMMDGRKLPHCLRTKLAPARMWPRNVLAAVKVAGQGEPSPIVDVRCTETTAVGGNAARRKETCRVPRGRKTLPVFEGCGAGRGSAPETPMEAGARTTATGCTLNGTGTIAGGGAVGTSAPTSRCKKRPRIQEHSTNSTRVQQGASLQALSGGELSTCTEVSENRSSSCGHPRKRSFSQVYDARERQNGKENYSDGVSETMEFDAVDSGQEGRVGWAAMRTVETCQFHPAEGTRADAVNLT